MIQVAPSAQVGGAEADRPLGLRRRVGDLQVEVELLRPLLPGPLRGEVVGRALELDLLTVGRAQAEPVGVLPDHVPAGELGVERALLLDVRRIEDRDVQDRYLSHAAHLARARRQNRRLTEPGRPGKCWLGRG